MFEYTTTYAPVKNYTSGIPRYYDDFKYLTGYYGGTVKYDYIYYLLDNNNRFISDISKYVENSTIEYHADEAIQGTMNITISRDITIDQNLNRIQPIVKYIKPNGDIVKKDCGIFIPSTLTEKEEEIATTYDIQCYNLMAIISQKKTTDRYIIPSGLNVITAVINVLEDELGITKHNVYGTDSEVSANRDYDIGTSYLEIINDLLQSIGYTKLYVSNTGVYKAKPKDIPTVDSIKFRYNDKSTEVGVTRTKDLFNVPNELVAYHSNDDGYTRYVVTNASGNELSIASRGYTVTKEYEIEQAADVAAITLIARRKLWEESQVYDTITYSSAIVPWHGHLDIIELTYDNLDIPKDIYEEVGWTMNLDDSFSMEHEIRRVVNINV